MKAIDRGAGDRLLPAIKRKALPAFTLVFPVRKVSLRAQRLDSAGGDQAAAACTSDSLLELRAVAIP